MEIRKPIKYLGGVEIQVRTPFTDKYLGDKLPSAEFTLDDVNAGNKKQFGPVKPEPPIVPPVAEQESKTTFGLDNFIARVKDDSFARVNRFEVLITKCPGTTHGNTIKLLNMYCEQSQLPLLNINTKPLQIYGPAHQRAVSIDFGGEGLVMQFYVDRDMKVKRVFDRWMERIVNVGSYNVQYPDTYMRNIIINQLDEKNNITYSVKLIDAFPRAQQMLQLDYGGDGIHRLQVSFVYRKWEYVNPRAPVSSIAPPSTATSDNIPKATSTPTQKRNKTPGAKSGLERRADHDRTTEILEYHARQANKRRRINK